MEIEPFKATDRATSFLVVSAPGIAFAVERLPTGEDVKPAVMRLHCCTPLVEAKGSQIAFGICCSTSRGNMVGTRCIPHRSQTWRVELEHLLKARFVCRRPVYQVVRPIWCNRESLPTIAHSSSGRRILHPWQSGCSR